MTALKQKLGGSQMFTLAVGALIGGGWVVMLGQWLEQAGPLGAGLAFASGGALMILVGLCYGEMSAMIPLSGGEVAYAQRVFGPRFAFAVGWFLALCYVAVTAFEALSVAWVVGVLVPALQGSAVSLAIGFSGAALLAC